MVFNFDKPETKDFTETVRLLCNLSHFVIVDIARAASAALAKGSGRCPVRQCGEKHLCARSAVMTG
jgi:hypothetical protein